MKSIKISSLYRSLASMFYGSSVKKSLSCSTNCCNNDWTLEKHKFESLACKLTEPKLAERKNELQKEVFSRVKYTKEIETGSIFSFPYDEKFLLNITKYIISEKRCCTFFIFEIKLNKTNEILLKITGPIEAKEMLKMFLAEGKRKY